MYRQDFHCLFIIQKISNAEKMNIFVTEEKIVQI